MSPQKRRWKPLVAAGLAAGLVQVLAGVTMYVRGVYFAAWSGPVSLLLLAVCVAGGTWWYVTRVIGQRTYLTALVAGMVIALLTGVVYVAYNIVSISFFYPRFLEDLAQVRFAQRFPDLHGAQARQALESLRAETTMGRVVAGNLMGFCIRGTVLAALVAAVLRRGPRGAV